MKHDPIHQRPPQLPPQQISLDVLKEKYLKGTEQGAEEVFVRVARALASVEHPECRAEVEAILLENMRQGAIGAGRIMSAAAAVWAMTSLVFAQKVRMLDNVLDLTWWPLPQQQKESADKRRIGVGFTGLGNALTMLGLKYNGHAGREMAARIAETMRDAAYEASIDLAKEKGAFPLFRADDYLAQGTFASRLPQAIQDKIRKFGIRNSHLISIAPTGTVSLAFADNASNGIEPAFSWTYKRKKREADGTTREYSVEDHAWRLYHALGGKDDALPESFVSALEMSAQDHIAMMKTVQPYVDTAISKTVNVAADYPFEDFKDLYLQAWRHGLKGLATYRPNSILGSVLEATVPQSQLEDKQTTSKEPSLIKKDGCEFCTQCGELGTCG